AVVAVMISTRITVCAVRQSLCVSFLVVWLAACRWFVSPFLMALYSFFFSFNWVSVCCFFFFFQAEDGIRDWSVTGVQTCALPILQYGHQVAQKYSITGWPRKSASVTFLPS